MAKGIVKKVPDAPWENKKVPKAPFDNQSYGLVQLAKAISQNTAQNLKGSFELLEYLKKQELRKVEINIPEIKIPEIKMPHVVVPEIKIPEQQVNIKAPEVKTPEVTVNVPEAQTAKEWEFTITRANNGLIKSISAKAVK